MIEDKRNFISCFIISGLKLISNSLLSIAIYWGIVFLIYFSISYFLPLFPRMKSKYWYCVNTKLVITHLLNVTILLFFASFLLPFDFIRCWSRQHPTTKTRTSTERMINYSYVSQSVRFVSSSRKMSPDFI